MESFYTSQVCSITVLLGVSIGLQQYCGHDDQTSKHNSTAATGDWRRQPRSVCTLHSQCSADRAEEEEEEEEEEDEEE